MTSHRPRGLLIAALVALVVLAPTVPDEPLHLSGVMFASGIGLAVLAAIGGAVQGFRAEDAGARSEGRWVAGLGSLAVAGALVALVARALSQLS